MSWIVAILAVSLTASLILNYGQAQLISRQQKMIRDANDWIEPIFPESWEAEEE